MKTIKFLFTVTTLASLALAQDDPPARATRLNLIEGQVSFQPAGGDNWEAALLNRPLIAGDRLWADEGARAELHVGSAAVRMGSGTSFTFAALDDRRMQADLVQGSLIVRLREVFDDETYEIDTPHVSFILLRAGEYRVDVQPDGFATILTVRSGEGEVSGGGQTYLVTPRDQVRISGNNNLTFESRDLPNPDWFDRWAQERDIREDRSQSAQYAGRGVVGYEDLDDHGVWTEDPGYGRVWAPRNIPAGWEPYRYGHWSYIPPWGWTWIDDSPWGFAPFHYGRWVVLGAGWVWIPGPVVMRPVYAPAMVAWVGGAPRGGIGVSVGWFPLGPREVYVPAHRASVAYVSRVNITNTRVTNVQVTNVYNNRSAMNDQTYVNRRHVTVVSHEDMASGRRVQRSAGMVPLDAGRDMRVTRTVDVTPRRGASSEARQAGSVPPPSVVNRRTVTRTTEVRRSEPTSIPRPVTRVPQAMQEDRAPRRPTEIPQVESPRPVDRQRPIEAQRPVEGPVQRDRPAPVRERSEEILRPTPRLEPPVRIEPRRDQREERRIERPAPPRVDPPARVERRQEERQERRVEQPTPPRVEPPARVERRQEQRTERPAREENKKEVKKEQ